MGLGVCPADQNEQKFQTLDMQTEPRDEWLWEQETFGRRAAPRSSELCLYSVTLMLGQRICWQREDIAH